MFPSSSKLPSFQASTVPRQQAPLPPCVAPLITPLLRSANACCVVAVAVAVAVAVGWHGGLGMGERMIIHRGTPAPP